MSEINGLGTSEYSYPMKTVFSAAKRALSISGSYDLVKIDEVGHRLVLESGASLASWGEIITIEFSSTSTKGTHVRVTSSFKRNTGSSGKVGPNKNQKNVNLVISIISEELASTANLKASPKPAAGSAAKRDPDFPWVADPFARSYSAPPLAKQYTLIGVAGLIIVVMIYALLSNGPAEPEKEAAPKTTASSTPVATPKATVSKTPSKPKPKKTIASVAKCSEAAVAVTMVRNVFSDASATPNQVSSILNEAARMWSKEAQGASGSKREWLSKMAELARDVDSYLRTGSPSNGATKFDQLFANMGLVNNFCN
jgi:hypothetical protein